MNSSNEMVEKYSSLDSSTRIEISPKLWDEASSKANGLFADGLKEKFKDNAELLAKIAAGLAAAQGDESSLKILYAIQAAQAAINQKLTLIIDFLNQKLPTILRGIVDTAFVFSIYNDIAPKGIAIAALIKTINDSPEATDEARKDWSIKLSKIAIEVLEIGLKVLKYGPQWHTHALLAWTTAKPAFDKAISLANTEAAMEYKNGVVGLARAYLTQLYPSLDQAFPDSFASRLAFLKGKVAWAQPVVAIYPLGRRTYMALNWGPNLQDSSSFTLFGAFYEVLSIEGSMNGDDHLMSIKLEGADINNPVQIYERIRTQMYVAPWYLPLPANTFNWPRYNEAASLISQATVVINTFPPLVAVLEPEVRELQCFVAGLEHYSGAASSQAIKNVVLSKQWF